MVDEEEVTGRRGFGVVVVVVVAVVVKPVGVRSGSCYCCCSGCLV